MSTENASPQKTQMAARRFVPARPDQIFALLSDPARHQQTEPGDWVGDAFDTEPLTGVGQVFGIQMFHVNAGGHYRMDNKVIAFDKDRTIAWEPGQYDDDGELGTGGWTWRYDLAEKDGGTEVTLTYDWSAVPQPQRAEFGLPPFGAEFLEESLASLDRAL